VRPLIGITTHFLPIQDGGRPYHVTYGRNALAIERAGGLPVLIPSGLDIATLRAIYDRVDAVMVPGGGDVNPERYNAARHTSVYRVDDARDQSEIQVVRWSVEDNRPLFGICRGNQLINIALGGTLVQDIPSLVDTPIKHDYPQPEIPHTHRAHNITIDADSRLAQIMGTTTLTVNSLHHQAIEQPAPTVKITAYAPDGVIEALEIPGLHFALSVQWHPEDMIEDDPAMQQLFNAFVQAARESALRSSSSHSATA
jgi:putative glutamine amidotransferase